MAALQAAAAEDQKAADTGKASNKVEEIAQSISAAQGQAKAEEAE